MPATIQFGGVGKQNKNNDQLFVMGRKKQYV